jgi:hypothetical protein
LAHFSDLKAFELFDKYLISNADSLGLNELELQLLVVFWSGNEVDYDSKPSID